MAAQNNAVPLNEVSQLLHMSGEGELDEIRLWFPRVASEIDSLQEEVRAATDYLLARLERQRVLVIVGGDQASS
jgi:hypothetical protein